MNKPPIWFMPVCILALLWNLAGLAAVLNDASLRASDIAALPEAQRAMYAARPGWSVVASLVAVGTGSLGSLALLFRRTLSFPLLLVSLLALVLQDVALFLIVGRSVPLGTVPYVLQGLVLVIAVALVMLARRAGSRQWLRRAAV